MRKLLSLAVSLFVVLFVSCTQQNPTPAAAPNNSGESIEAVKAVSREVQALKDESKALVTRIEKYEAGLDAVKSAAASTEQRIEKDWAAFFTYTNATQTSLQLIYDELIRQANVSSNLGLQVLFLNLKSDNGEAVFDAADPSGYSRVNTDSGFFLVMLKNVEPYLDGYRINLDVGNPLSATYKNLKFRVTWGKKFDSKQSANEPGGYTNWLAGLHAKDISVTEDLLPGAWNKIQFVLSPAKSDELGYVKMRLSTDTASLRRSTP